MIKKFGLNERVEKKVLKHHKKFSNIMPGPCDICIKMAIEETKKEMQKQYGKRLENIEKRIIKLEKIK